MAAQQRTLGRILDHHFRQHPDREILILQHAGGPDITLTYRQLLQGAAGAARALERSSVQPGDVVVLILQHGADLAYAFFGAILYGAIPSIMPFLTEKLQPERYRASMASLVAVAQPAAVFTYAAFAPEIHAALKPGGSVRAVLLSDDFCLAEQPEIENLPGIHRDEEDIALLQHSSGTTGLQKGVALSHRAVLNQLESYGEAIRLEERDVFVSWLPLYHDMGLIAGFIMPILSGNLLVLMSPFDWVRAPYRLMQAVSKYRGTLTWLPNFAYNFCAQKVRDRHLEDVDLSSWRAVINCSEPMRWESHQAFLERFAPHGFLESALATSYAMAENVFAVTQGGIDAPITVDEVDRESIQTELRAQPAQPGRPSVRMLSAGKPIAGTAVSVLAPDRSTLPERAVGEIALKSNCMLTGYYNRPDETETAFHDGWYLTGDFGYIADGEVYITGRKKDLIIVGGKNVYPQDLEALAGQVAGVHPGRVAAFGVFNEETGTEDVVMIAEVDTHEPQQRSEIADAMRAAVTRGSDVTLHNVHLVPRGWMVKTSSGKNSRSANREKFLQEILAGA